MLRTPSRDFALLYFEKGAVTPSLKGFTAGAKYQWQWFHPLTGDWERPIEIVAGTDGALAAPAFPKRGSVDWAAKVKAR